MKAHLSNGSEPARREMGVEVAEEEGRLEEEHHRGPNGSAAAEPGKDPLGDHRLDLKDEPGTEDHGRGEGDIEGARTTSCPGG